MNIPASAAPVPVVDKTETTANTDKVIVAPHRALYDMTLSSVKNGSTITDVSGKMIFEWADACDGWAVQQNLHLHFSHGENEDSDVSSNEVTWESKDAKKYNFNIRRITDGKETENYRGKADVSDAKPRAIYNIPEGKVAELTDSTLFPSSHTKLIIANAEAGHSFFTRRVFDGTDEEGSNDVSVFIGAPVTKAAVTTGDAALDSNPLLGAPEWPVHMAFFKLDDPTGEPDFEMDIKLLANGVVRTIRIDYGDFSVTGTLKALEALPAPHC